MTVNLGDDLGFYIGLYLLGGLDLVDPVHFQALVGSLVIGARAGWQQLLLMAMLVALSTFATNGLIAWVIASVLEATQNPELVLWLQVAFGATVFVLGTVLVWRRVIRGEGQPHHHACEHDQLVECHDDHHDPHPGHDQSHDHGHRDHTHDHDHEHDHHHCHHPHHQLLHWLATRFSSRGKDVQEVPSADLADEEQSWWDAIVMGVVGGGMPCPVVISASMASLSLGTDGQWLVGLLVFALGIGTAVMFVGILAMSGHRLVARWYTPASGLRGSQVFPKATAVVVLLLGIFLTVRPFYEWGNLNAPEGSHDHHHHEFQQFIPIQPQQ